MKIQDSYIVPVSFVFEGRFFIKADSIEQANEYAEKHCGLVLGGKIHSSLPEDSVDWDFPIHPEKEIHEYMIEKE